MEASSENGFLQNFDIYCDEINERVSISRVLNDAFLKEMIKSICEEANERIASKEKEILLLNKRLNSFNKLDFGTEFVTIDSEIEKTISRIRQDLFETGLDSNFEKKMGRFRVLMEKEIETLKGVVDNEKIDAAKTILNFEFEKLSGLFGFFKSTVFEKQYEHELQKEVSSIVFKSYFETLHNEFEFKLHGEIDAFRSVQQDWDNKVRDFDTLREELNSISKSLLESDFGNISKVNNNNNDLNIGMGTGTGTDEELEVHLKHLSKDETINYFKCEINKLRRQNEIVLAEKTEELFKLKRELLKERGSSSFKKDKDFEFIRAKLPEIIAKMDEILSNDVKWPLINMDQTEEICKLKGKIDFLLGENKNLRDLLEKTKSEVSKLYLSEEGYLGKMEKLSDEIENLKILGDVKDMVSKTVIKEAFEGHMCKIEKLSEENENLKILGDVRDMINRTMTKEAFEGHKCKIEKLPDETENLKILVDVRDMVNQTVIKEAFESHMHKIEELSDEIENLNIFGDFRDIINRTVLKEAFEGHICKIEDMRFQMEKLQEKSFVQEKLLISVDQEIVKLKEIVSFLMDENEKLAFGTESRLEKQKNKVDLIRVEIDLLKEKSRDQKDYILDSKGEIEMYKNKLDRVLKQVSLYELEIEKQRDNQRVFLSFSMKGIWDKFTEFENLLQDGIEKNENRLRKLSSEFSRLAQKVTQLRKNEIRYRQMLEIRTSNLEKAEAEVDLLGDEVDALLSLLGQIYIALDHYSPVFVHYPGVMEILKLVKSELQGKNI